MTEDSKLPDIDVDFPMPAGLKVTPEDHPYRILLMTDLGGSEAGTIVGTLQGGVVDITPDTLNGLFKAARPTLSWKTVDPTITGNVMVELELAFDSLRSFDPIHLLSRIPATKSLFAAREKIVERMRGGLAAESLVDALAELTRGAPELAWLTDSLRRMPTKGAVAVGVDDVLDQLDFDTESETAPSGSPASPLGRLVATSAADGSSIPPEEASSLRRALGEIDRRLSLWLTAVLHAPPVQALESAWRSLAFLVAHLDFRRGIRLSVLHTRRGEALERLRTCVIDPVFDAGMTAPNLIVVDRSFGQSAPDIETLDELAQHAASLPAVAVVGAAPEFLGAKYAWQIATLPPLVGLLQQWQFAKWNTLRREPYARAIGLVLGRGLLRGPHRRAEATDLDYVYREECAAEKDLIWANGAIALACAVARSVAGSRWPTAFCGPLFGRVEDFEAFTGGPKGDKEFGPTDVRLPTERLGELGTAGVNLVAALRDPPDAIIWNGVSAAHAASDDTKTIYEITLPYQLLAARAGQLLIDLKPHLAGRDAQAVAALVRQHLRAWLPYENEPSPEQLAVHARPSATDPSVIELAVTVTPPERILPGAVPIGLGYRL